MKRRKYGNVPTTVGGIRFHSKKEADRYADLKLLERAREITDLKRQYKMRLEVNGKHICDYIADFRYVEHPFKPIDRAIVVIEDIKPFDKKKRKFRTTADFKIKWKLAQALYPFVDHWRLT